MEEKISKTKYFIITTLLTIVLFFNLIQWKSVEIGVIFGVAYILFFSFVLGSLFIKKLGWQIIFGLLFLFSIVATCGSIFIYFSYFNDYALAAIMIGIPILLIAPYYNVHLREKISLKKIILDHFDKILDRKESKTKIILVYTYLILIVLGFYLLASGQTSQSIQSPWQVVFSQFGILYFLATAILLTYTLTAKRTKLPLALIVLHTFLSTSVALIVYKIGYGFDPFIHQATEKIILETGTITPKPLYYLGQYSLVVFLAKLTFLNLQTIDKFLVPVLASLFLPLTTFFVFSHWIKRNFALTLSLSILIIPFSSFIMTAPQNLANLFFIITILLSILYFRGDVKISFLYFTSIATMAIHPLAGIPLFIVVFLFGLFKGFFDSYKHNLNLYFVTALVFTLFLPIAFIANGASLYFPEKLLPTNFNLINLINKFNPILDFVYFINLNKVLLGLLVVILGVAYLIKHKLLKNNAAYFIAAFVIFANYLIVKYFLIFPELRNYDQVDFVSRISKLSFYVLLPIFLLGLHLLIKKYWSKDIFFKTFLILALAGLISTSFYLSYPRVNNYEPAKFFSLSESDIKTVKLIEQSANPNHIVLANQMVGVAAIKEFGFKKYYNNQFYYSMPMGSPRTLYNLFLEMTYKNATKETMIKAMNEADVNEAYFVINNYWRNFEKIVADATISADEIYLIDGGKSYVFKYLKD